MPIIGHFYEPLMEYRAIAIFVRQSTMDFPSYLGLLFDRLILVRVMGERIDQSIDPND